MLVTISHIYITYIHLINYPCYFFQMNFMYSIDIDLHFNNDNLNKAYNNY